MSRCLMRHFDNRRARKITDGPSSIARSPADSTSPVNNNDDLAEN